MKTTHLIALTATIVACSVATASAHPAADRSANQSSKPSAVTPADVAAQRDQISNEQWKRNQAQPADVPLSDRTATDGGLPLGLVVLAVTVPLGLLIVAIGRPALSYGRRRRHPTSVAG